MQDWHDKYDRLRDEHMGLRRKYIELQEEIKRQATKIRSSQSFEIVDGKSQHEHIQTLYSENQALTTKCRALELRLARMNAKIDESKKGHKRRLSVHVGVQVNCTMDSLDSKTDDKVGPLIEALRHRLDELESDLSRLTAENERLTAIVSEDPHATQIESTMRESTYEMTLLENKYEDIQAQLRSAQVIHNQSVAQMEKLMADNLEMKETISRFKGFEGEVEIRDKTINNLRQEVIMLRNDSIRLHEAIDQLTSRPFNDANTSLQSFMVQIGDLECQVDILNAQLDNERQHTKVLEQSKKVLQSRVATLQAQLETSVQTKVALRLEVEQLRVHHNMASLKLRLFENPADTLLTTALDYAAKISFQPSEVAFLEDTKQSMKTAFSSTMQKMRVTTSMEMANYDRRVSILQELNDDLQDELRRLEKQFSSEIDYLKSKLNQAEQTNIGLKREMAKLFSKRKQLQYAAKPLLEGEIDITELQIVLSDLEVLPTWQNVNLIAICDYGDYVTQLSPVVCPKSAPLNFAISYICVVDDDFFASPYIGVELRSIDDYQETLLASGLLSLETLFSSSTGNADLRLEFFHPISGCQVASVAARLRLQYPVDEVYRAYSTPDTKQVTPFTSEIIVVTLLSVYWPKAPLNDWGSIKYNILGYQGVVESVQWTSSYMAIPHASRQFSLQKSARLIEFIKTYKVAIEVDKCGIAQVPLTLSSPFLASVALDRDDNIVGRLCLEIHCKKFSVSKNVEHYLAAMQVQFQAQENLVDVLRFLLYTDARFVWYRNQSLHNVPLNGPLEVGEFKCYLESLEPWAKHVCTSLLDTSKFKWHPTWLQMETETRDCFQSHVQQKSWTEAFDKLRKPTWPHVRRILHNLMKKT
ncbi:unnamed protein product [Aphanomyces euteiches]